MLGHHSNEKSTTRVWLEHHHYQCRRANPQEFVDKLHQKIMWIVLTIYCTHTRQYNSRHLSIPPCCGVQSSNTIVWQCVLTAFLSVSTMDQPRGIIRLPSSYSSLQNSAIPLFPCFLHQYTSYIVHHQCLGTI
jgi:hypothetical protein